MSRDAAAIEPIAPMVPRRRARVATVHRLDGRTRAAQRTRELIRTFIAALGGERAVTGARLVDVKRAAELSAIAEQARAAALQDASAYDLAELVKLEGVADRATRRLCIKAGAQARVPTLSEHFAAKRAAAGAGGGEPT